MHGRRGHLPVVGWLDITADWIADHAVFQGGGLVRFGDLGRRSDLVDGLTYLDGLGDLVHRSQLPTEGMRRFLLGRRFLFRHSSLLVRNGHIGALDRKSTRLNSS